MDKMYEDRLLNQKMIKIVGEIDYDTLTYVREALKMAEEKGFTELTVEIASYGGREHPGRIIYDLISTSRIKITGLVMPFASSSAFIILQACHVRRAFATADLLVHHVRRIPLMFSNYQSTIKERYLTDSQMNKLIANRTKLSYREFERLRSYDMTLNAIQCLKLGFIDEVIRPQEKKLIQGKLDNVKMNIPTNSDFLGFLDQYDKLRATGCPPIEFTLYPIDISDENLLNLYELLLHYQGHVTVISSEYLQGLLPLIMLAGDKRLTYYNSSFLLREPNMTNNAAIADSIRPAVQKLIGERLKLTNQFVKNEFLQRTNLTAKEYNHLLKSKNFFGADDAVKYGICHKKIMPNFKKK